MTELKDGLKVGILSLIPAVPLVRGVVLLCGSDNGSAHVWSLAGLEILFVGFP